MNRAFFSPGNVKSKPQFLKNPSAEVMAIGDGDNDVDMLAWAGLGVAMGDGQEETKAIADVVAPSFDEDGAAWAVERYVLPANGGEL